MISKRDSKKKPEQEATIAGAVQTLLNLDKIPFVKTEQSEILVCQICGHTWTTENAETILRSWKMHEKTIRGPLCDICWLLYSVTNQARVRGLTFKETIRRFLKGRGRQLHQDLRTVWEKL